jgi:hypothetical protein
MSSGSGRLFASEEAVGGCAPTSQRIVFGSEGWDDVPISTAVRASTALPMVYSPVKATTGRSQGTVTKCSGASVGIAPKSTGSST